MLGIRFRKQSVPAEAGRRIGCAPDTFLGPGLQTALGLIAAGEIGTPVSALTLFETPGPAADHRNLQLLLSRGAGPLFDIGPYYLTALVQALGPLASVVATARTARPRRVLQAGPEAGPLPALGPFDQLEQASLGWSYDAECQNLWIWVAESAAERVVRYEGGRLPVGPSAPYSVGNRPAGIR